MLAPMHDDVAIDQQLARLRHELEPALQQLVPALHEDLRQLAASQRRRFDAPPTLSTTAVVNELYLKFAQSSGVAVDSRRHFFALAALAMRQILTDHARRRTDALRTGLDEALAVPADDAQRLLDIDAALSRLAALQPRLVDVVNCRFFGGYTEEETAAILGVTDRTVRRDWEKARAWLADALDPA
jgi:RNA polymerase sigma factor (TIGR02999 family)